MNKEPLKNVIASRNLHTSSLAYRQAGENAEPATKAFTLIELMLAITLFSIYSLAFFQLSLTVIQYDASTELEYEALNYAQEGIEAVRQMRDRNYLLVSNGDHGLSLTNDTWSFVAAPERIDNFFDRTVTVEDVYRDTNNNMSESGTFDPETKKVTSLVEWDERSVIPRSISIESYLANWTGDDWIQETCDEFENGTFENIETIGTSAPPVNDCAITLSLIEQSSTFFASADLGEHANDVYVEGNYAYVANDKTNAGFTIVNVQDPENPVIVKELDVGGKGRYITKDGNYVYMGVQKSGGGFVIVDVSNPASATKIATLNVGGYGNQPKASGNYVFFGVENDDGGFKVIDVNNKSSPVVRKTLDFDATVQAVYLKNTYAYLGLDDDHLAFRVVSISDPINPQLRASINVGEEINAIDISGPIAYAATEEDDDALQVIDITNPESPSLITQNDGDNEGEIQDISILDNYLYAAVDNTNGGLMAFSIENPLAPSWLYTTDITGKGTGIQALGNYIYITTDVNNRGLVIIGTTQTSVSTSGTYTSNILDTGSTDTRYNFIEWDHNEVPGGDVKFQMKTADTGDNLATATWIGSDGTNATYYETSRTNIILDPAKTGVRFAQFKAFIDSDGATSPTIESVRINFTP